MRYVHKSHVHVILHKHMCGEWFYYKDNIFSYWSKGRMKSFYEHLPSSLVLVLFALITYARFVGSLCLLMLGKHFYYPYIYKKIYCLSFKEFCWIDVFRESIISKMWVFEMFKFWKTVEREINGILGDKLREGYKNCIARGLKDWNVNVYVMVS